MKMTPFRQFAVLAVAIGLGSLNVRAADVAPDALPLKDALNLKGGKSIVFQPFAIKPGQILRVTHTQFGDGSVRPEGRRAVQLVVYGTTPVEGVYPVLHNTIHILDRNKDGVTVLPDYVHPGGANTQGIIAVLIGLLLPAVQTGDALPAPLPPNDSISAEVHDPTGIGLLVPAVQKVREAAAR